MKLASKFKETEIGMIPQDWEIESVQGLVNEEIIEKPMDGNHGNIHPKGNDFVTEGIPFIMASDLENGKVNLNNCNFISKTQADKLQKGFSHEGDVLITHKGVIGRTAIVQKLKTEYIMLSPQVTYYRIINNKMLNNFFLKYYFDYSSFQQYLKSWAGNGSTRDYLGITEQRKLFILIPRINDQRAIAKILSSLDSKIELNREMNKTLEEIAGALFKRWFVDFEFPNEEGKPYKSSGGKMVESELGEIPEGWRVVTLKDICKIVMGQSPPGETYNEQGEGIPFYQGIRDFGLRYPQERIYCTAPSRHAENGDVLFSVRAPVGNLNIASQRCAIGRGVASLKTKDGGQSYLYYLLKATISRWNVFEAEGTVFGSVGKTDVENFHVIQPPASLIQKTEAALSSLDNNIKNNEKQTSNLANIRDLLLPKLMSGKIRVKVS